MTTIDTLDEAEAPFAGSRVVEAAPKEPRRRGDLWWRYLISIVAIAFAIFPALYVALGGVQLRCRRSRAPR